MDKQLLFDMLSYSKSPYHAVEFVKNQLEKVGYVQLYETDEWQLEKNRGYYVIRDSSSIIAFYNSGGGFNIVASHSDFPAFGIKCDEFGIYGKMLTEKYGGMMYYTWFDRPLAIAGRVVVKSTCGLETRLVSLDERVVIPSLAIHLNTGVNKDFSPNPAVDLLPLTGLGSNKNLISIIKEKLGESLDIVSWDLYLTSADEPMCIGYENELLLSPRIDDIECVAASLGAFLRKRKATNMTPVLAVFNNEEIGSGTKQGAQSDFLYSVLRRISSDEQDYMRRISASFMVSADNAHALHPNNPDKSDRKYAPTLGGGVVIKHNLQARYATDAISCAVFSEMAEKTGAKLQHYYNRADLPGGSTLGSISNTKVAVATVDIGIPQLAMHSACETSAISDYFEMVKALLGVYNSSLELRDNKINII